MDRATLQAMMAVQWEQAKGQLRATVALAGHRRLLEEVRTMEDDQVCSEWWAKLDKRVEDLIKGIEDDGLVE